MKDRILDEIRRTAATNDGVPLGQERFEEVTGIGKGAWRGRYWRRWSDAIAEAGFSPNLPLVRHDPEDLVRHLAELTLKNGRFPTYADTKLARAADKDFPTHHVFTRLGSVEQRVELVRRFVANTPSFARVGTILASLPQTSEEDNSGGDDGGDGSVYMLRLGKHYKIGKTFSVPRRHREIALELPEKPDVVHVIATDDPTGIEAYWHARFSSKRTNGEWFELTRADIKAVKRRKFM